MNKYLRLALGVLKNATIIIPLIEGVVYAVQALINPKKEEKDA